MRNATALPVDMVSCGIAQPTMGDALVIAEVAKAVRFAAASNPLSGKTNSSKSPLQRTAFIPVFSMKDLTRRKALPGEVE